MKYFLIILALFWTKSHFGQSFSSHPIALTPTVFPNITFNEDAYLNKVKQKLANDFEVEMIKKYSEKSLADQKAFFNSNEIYHNWPEATDFVKRVLLRAVPKEYDTKDVKIFVVRSPDLNAYCMEDGNITVTSGFLAFMNNEAELAATLSHEYGHFYCNHNYSDYKALKMANIAYEQQIKRNGSTNPKKIYKKYYAQVKDAERQADTFSVKFAAVNGYSPEGIVSDFENFDRVTKKYSMLKGYRKRPEYFSSHPTTEERINTAKVGIEKLNGNGKNFLVDSLEFARVKKRAIDECIYLLFDQLRFDECIELTFLQHLYYPDDEFYLYFLVESLNSQVKCVKYYGDVSFITYCYNLEKTKSKFNPYCYSGKFNSWYQSPDFKNSIFNHMKSGIFSLTDADLTRIKATELMRQDTIQFYTNRQAYAYFSKKIKNSGTVFNMPRKQMELPIENKCENKPSNSELENDLCEIFNNYNRFDQKWDSLEQGMFVLQNIRFYKNEGLKILPYENQEGQKKIRSEYDTFISNRTFQNIINEDKLNFRENSKIKYISNYIESISDENFFGISTDMDFLNLCPEFVLQSMKNNVETIFLVNFRFMNFDIRRMSPYYVYPKSSALIYMIDIRNKRITIRNLDLGTYAAGSTYTDEIEKAFKECESLIKN